MKRVSNMDLKLKDVAVRLFLAALFGLIIAFAFGSCQVSGRSDDTVACDTLRMKYAKLLTIIKHKVDAANVGLCKTGKLHASDSLAYTEVIIRNPWKKNAVLHRYLLVAKGEQGDSVVASLQGNQADIVRTPVKSSIVFTSPHCQLMCELGCRSAIKGVCDLDYINIKGIREQVKDCGSSMAPNIESIILLKPEALLISPFENSGGYGKLDKLHIPIIETADYMETSPLGRAEWMKFYGMLFGSDRSDSLFSAIEKEYFWLKGQAKTLPKGLSILTERKTGNVWYVPGGQSTIGVLLKDANARYIFEDDEHSGSLPMSPEQILAKGKKVDVWAFKYFGPQPLTRPQLLYEYKGYEALMAFKTKDIYECNTSNQPYFELTSFHPEVLLREFIILAHQDYSFGKLRFYKQMDAPDDLPVWGKTEECKK